MKTVKILAVLAMISVGTTASAQRKVIQRATSTSAEQTTERGSNVRIEGMGITKTVTMNGGTLDVEGADSNITVRGFANQINIQGANVTVRVDRVNAVKIEGANTHVYYTSTGNKSGKVAVSVFGVNSGATKSR